MRKTSKPTQARIKQRLRYEPDTGLWFWQGTTKTGRRRSGTVRAGSLRGDGYYDIRLDELLYRAHILAWIYMTGEPPESDIDHEDRDRGNNRWGNLRLATDAENQANRPAQANNTSGYKGVTWHKMSGKWWARANVGGKQHSFGLFHDVHEAGLAASQGRRKLHGRFARD